MPRVRQSDYFFSTTWTVTSVTNNAGMWTGADAMTTATKKPCVAGGSSSPNPTWRSCS